MNKKVIFSIIGGCALLLLCACVGSTVFLLPRLKDEAVKINNDQLNESLKKLGSITQTPTVSPTSTNPSYTTFTSQKYGFEMQYPKDWTKSEGEQGTVILVKSPKEDSLDTFTENINVVTEDLSAKDISLEAYMDAAVSNVEKYIENVDISNQTKTKLGGKDAYVVIYTGISNGLDLKWRQTIAINNKSAYIVTFTALEDDYSKYEKTAQEITNTFKFK